MASTYELISSYTATGSVSNIDFTSIPATYTDLLLKWSLRDTTAADYFGIKFNNSSASFTSRTLTGNGSTAGSTNAANNLFGAAVDSSSYTASTFSNGELYLPNYAGSINKSFSLDTVTETNATATYMTLNAGLWSNSAAINQITLTAASSFVIYSTAYLYGVKNA